jgi:hypothetical protein
VIRCLLILVLMCLASTAWSDGQCPVGMYQSGGNDYIACTPYSNASQGGNEGQSSLAAPPPPPIPMVWETRWGAIATENNGSGFGAVTGVETKQEAERQAFSQCKASATTPKAECKIILPYSDQCVALAWGAGGGSRVNSAVDLATAEAHALGNCNKYSQSGCQIYYSDCSFAEAVPPSHK